MMPSHSLVPVIAALLGLLTAAVSPAGVCLCHVPANPQQAVEPTADAPVCEGCCCSQAPAADSLQANCCDSTHHSQDGQPCGCCVTKVPVALPTPVVATHLDLDSSPLVLSESSVAQVAMPAEFANRNLVTPNRPSLQSLLCVWRL